MSITKTEELVTCIAYPALDSSAEPTTNDGNPTLQVAMNITFDDPDDFELPATSNHYYVISRFDKDGQPTSVASQPALVKSIAEAIWI